MALKIRSLLIRDPFFLRRYGHRKVESSGDNAERGVAARNFFLGSGFFNIQRATQKERPVRVGLGTDIGAGTSFSILATLNEAYKVQQGVYDQWLISLGTAGDTISADIKTLQQFAQSKLEQWSKATELGADFLKTAVDICRSIIEMIKT